MDKRVVAIVQARMSSTRLPGKVLLPLVGNETALSFTVLRAAQALKVQEVVVATTKNPCDKVIVDYCEERNWSWFRGSERNVLKRVINAATAFNADIIVDLTADCPFVDPSHIDALIGILERESADYASNIVVPRSLPDGFDVQVCTTKALRKCLKVLHNKEHSSWNIMAHWEVGGYPFKIRKLTPCEAKYARPDLALTLDTPQDYALMKLLLDELFLTLYNYVHGSGLRHGKSQATKGKFLIERAKFENFMDILLYDKQLVKINKKVKRKEPTL